MATSGGAMLFILTAVSALAGPITWTVNATLDDGATVTGFFVFDPDLFGPHQFRRHYEL